MTVCPLPCAGRFAARAERGATNVLRAPEQFVAHASRRNKGQDRFCRWRIDGDVRRGHADPLRSPGWAAGRDLPGVCTCGVAIVVAVIMGSMLALAVDKKRSDITSAYVQSLGSPWGCA